MSVVLVVEIISCLTECTKNIICAFLFEVKFFGGSLGLSNDHQYNGTSNLAHLVFILLILLNISCILFTFYLAYIQYQYMIDI